MYQRYNTILKFHIYDDPAVINMTATPNSTANSNPTATPGRRVRIELVVHSKEASQLTEIIEISIIFGIYSEQYSF